MQLVFFQIGYKVYWDRFKSETFGKICQLSNHVSYNDLMQVSMMLGVKIVYVRYIQYSSVGKHWKK